jgi:hypothetical protein
MRMRRLVLLLALAGSVPANAQRISRVDFDSVRLATKATGTRTYYPQLLKQFEATDSTLTPPDFKLIYYGQVFTDQYAPYGGVQLTDFLALYNKKQYAEAIPVGEKLLAKAPLAMQLTFKLLVCNYQLANRARAQYYARRYFPLLRAIQASGDGTSSATAYVVAVVHDEYEMLRALKLSSSKQALVGHTDVLTVTPIDNEGNPTGEKAREIYFDVTQSLAALSREFRVKK